MNKVIVMDMVFNAGSVPDFGGIYLVSRGENGVNEYGCKNLSDAAKLSNITNAAPGSRCVFSNGTVYRLEADGEWDTIEGGSGGGGGNGADAATICAIIDGSLSSIVNDTATSVGRCAFFGRDNLLSADFAAVTSLGQNCFANSNLEKLILRAPQVVTFVNGNPFSGTWIDDDEGEIYVPDDLVAAYKADSNWSGYSSEIKPLSQLSS